MNPNEILPPPETNNSPESQKKTEITHESQAAQKTEQSPFLNSGGGALSAVAVNDAQAHLSSIPGPTVQPQSTNVSFDVPDIAEDIDLIEKTWVKKAKDIVAATQGDPHTQNKQINRMKVEYIKKRYDKHIQIRDEA